MPESIALNDYTEAIIEDGKLQSLQFGDFIILNDVEEENVIRLDVTSFGPSKMSLRVGGLENDETPTLTVQCILMDTPIELSSEHVTLSEDQQRVTFTLSEQIQTQDAIVLPGHVRLNLSIPHPTVVLATKGEEEVEAILASAAIPTETPEAEIDQNRATISLDVNLFWRDKDDDIVYGLPLDSDDSGFSFRIKFKQSTVANTVPILGWAPNPDLDGVILHLLSHPEHWTFDTPTETPALSIFDGHSLLGQDLATSSLLSGFQINVKEYELTEQGELRLHIGGSFMIGDETFTLDNGVIELDKSLTLKANRLPEVQYTLAQDKLVLAGEILTFHFHQHSQFILNLDPRSPYLALRKGTSPVKQPHGAVTVYLPGIEANPAEGEAVPTDFTADQLSQRFILDFDDDNESEGTLCRLTPGGVQMSAHARPVTIHLGTGSTPIIRNVQLERGYFKLDRGAYEIDIAASGELGYFEKASGRLTVRASNQTIAQPTDGEAGKVSLLIRFEPQLTGSWEDPSGSIEILDPGAQIDVWLVNNEWEVDGAISGEITLKAVEEWLEDAGEWLEAFFAKLSLRFDNLNLKKLVSLETTPDASISIQYQSDRLDLTLWEVLRFELTEFKLGYKQFIFAGNVHLTLSSGFYFMASIPRMSVSLDGSVKLDESKGPMRLSGKLKTPTGIQASLHLQREKNATHSRMAGTGVLSIPGWSDIRIACGVGKREVPRKENGEPTGETKTISMFFLFAEVDYPVTIYPAIVLRHMGLGFGINHRLRDLHRIRESGIKELGKDPRGLPDPAVPTDWEDAGTYDRTDVALVARTFVAPSPKGDGPFPYVADALVTLEPTGDFFIAFTSNMWLFSSIEDARSQAFRSQPAMQTIMAMYPRHGYIEAYSRTRKNSKMSAAPDAAAHSLNLYESEMYLKATPDMFRMRVGPTRTELKLAGFNLKGSFTYGIEASSQLAIMLMSLQLEGRFHLERSLGMRLGPLRVEAGLRLHARMGLSVLLAGGYLGSDLGIAFYGEVRVHISVDLSVYLQLRFRRRIKIGWVKITISWSKRLSATLSIAFDANVETLAATQGLAMRGAGQLRFRVFGISFKPKISFTVGNTSKLDVVQARLRPLLPKGHRELL